ncbi:hypothetical protein J6590_039311 [Homalodisca vitripennis]|nr:hypothetical protein J6590_039311 [Homalodisca vitripennis]
MALMYTLYQDSRIGVHVNSSCRVKRCSEAKLYLVLDSDIKIRSARGDTGLQQCDITCGGFPLYIGSYLTRQAKLEYLIPASAVYSSSSDGSRKQAGTRTAKTICYKKEITLVTTLEQVCSYRENYLMPCVILLHRVLCGWLCVGTVCTANVSYGNGTRDMSNCPPSILFLTNSSFPWITYLLEIFKVCDFQS